MDHFLKSYLSRRLFGKKSASKSNPATPPHPAAGRSPPPSYLSNKRAETEYDFPISREQRTYPKQPASERVPNSHPRPPVYGYGTPERRERKERMSYEPETNAPSSPFHPSGNRTPERRRKSSEYSREQQDRTYEADTRSNASPFHPFKSPSPSPYHTPDRCREHNADHYEAMYEPEANTMFQNRAPGSPFHQAGNRSPSPYRTPDRHSNEQFEDMYERDGDVTPRNSSPPSPFHPAANRSPPPQSYRTPDRRRNHPDNQQSEEVYERDGEVTPRNSSPPSPFHPAASRSPPPQPYRTPERRSNNNHGDEQMEAMYEPDGYVMRQDSPPRSPVHGGAYYSSSDDDNHSTYLFPEIGTPTRSMPVSANTTPVHHNYQIVVAENYEPPELADESQSFSIQEIAKMRGLKEESQSMISESYVSVANYRVKASVAETLQAIISKHGDIAASSKLQSNVTRSYYLESLAAVVMELRTSGLKDLTKTRVAEMAAVVKDMESVKIEVSWLKKAVAELGEAVEYAGEYEAAKAEREACERSDSFFRDFFIFNLFFDVEEKLTQRILITYISYFILLFL
ncbi:BnaC03g61260D [Brassica napus]|uniref:BnaC03g61260D protein n=1 Tax=Brassica napus TaxID=3708 RepID=A0A078ILN7_BRANA|nr:BnaC03g61260D [Brassica napus]